VSEKNTNEKETNEMYLRDESPPTEPLYRLSGVTKRYRGSGSVAVNALDGLDLEIGQGEYVVVAGPSGSGKSTLLQLLGALDRPSDGFASFEGRELSRLGERELADLRQTAIGFVFQQFNLIPTLTAAENIEAALAPSSMSSGGRASRIHDLLERVGLAPRRDHLPSELSGGEQQRVAIARALANEPRVLLADEPTGNLDTATGESILELLGSLWRSDGLTIVLVTHDPAIAGSAPRVVHLADGRVAGETGRRRRALAGVGEAGR
jgi:putative ABC transport system ATP-binding protein